MRAALVSVIALTFCLVGAYPRIGEHPESKLRKEYGKGLPLAGDDSKDDESNDSSKYEDERDEDDSERVGDDEKSDEGPSDEVEGRVKETSVRRKHFMDQYYVHSGPSKFEYGHVCEDPKDWEHRYEKRDFGKNRHQGQVKWGNADGDQGEHLWDFNHGGKDSDEDKEVKHKRNEHRFQAPRKKIQIKEKVIEKTSDGNGSKEYRRSKTGSTTYSGHKKEAGKYEEVVTRKNKKKDDIPYLYDPVPFDSDEPSRGFSKLDFDFDSNSDFEDHSSNRGFDSDDFDIDRMGLLSPELQFDMSSFSTEAKKDPETEAFSKKREKQDVRKGYRTTVEEVRRVDSDESRGSGDNKKKKTSLQEHQEIRRYGYFPSTVLKRSLPKDELKVEASSAHDAVQAGAQPEFHKFRIDPITGSLMEKMTGKKFQIYGILVDS